MENKQLIGLSLGMLALVVAGNVVANSMYSRTQINTDWKTAAIGGGIGIVAAVAVIKLLKK